MEPRLPYTEIAPDAYKAMLGLERYVSHSTIEPILANLIKLRVSQINGCAYCLDMHWKDLRALGEPESRLYGLDAWQETPLYTDRERAALEFAEATTLITQGHVKDEVFNRTRKHFNDRELVDLTFVIAAINAWNRLAITFRATPGVYQSHLTPKTAATTT